VSLECEERNDNHGGANHHHHLDLLPKGGNVGTRDLLAQVLRQPEAGEGRAKQVVDLRRRQYIAEVAVDVVVEHDSADGEADAAAEHAGLRDGALGGGADAGVRGQDTGHDGGGGEGHADAEAEDGLVAVLCGLARVRCGDCGHEAHAQQLEARRANEGEASVVALARDGTADEGSEGAADEKREKVDTGHEYIVAAGNLEAFGYDDGKGNVREASQESEAT